MAIQHKAPKAPKTKVSFLCSDCGHASPKWEGRCAACGAWGTYAEFAEPRRAPQAVRQQGRALAPEPAPIGEQSAPADHRLSLGMPEFDRLLGGGVVAGSVLLLAGHPGLGQATRLPPVRSGAPPPNRTRFSHNLDPPPPRAAGCAARVTGPPFGPPEPWGRRPCPARRCFR